MKKSFDSKKAEFVIVSHIQNGGGAIALHSLCKYLTELGYKARIFYTRCYDYNDSRRSEYFRQWFVGCMYDTVRKTAVKLVKTDYIRNKLWYRDYLFTPVKGCRRKFTPFIGKNTIVVYPEIMYGNPLKSDNVVRWLLYYNKLYNEQNPDSYSKNDLFFCYREVFNDEKLNPDVNKVRTPFYDLNFYRQTNFGERNGKCFIIRKGAERADLPKEYDGIIIDDMTEEQIVETFNKCKYCISYDTQTGYSKIAAMCGCISVIIPEQGRSKTDYISSEDENVGVAWGWDEKELEHAMQTREQVRSMFEEINRSGRESAENFAETCLDFFSRNS